MMISVKALIVGLVAISTIVQYEYNKDDFVWESYLLAQYFYGYHEKHGKYPFGQCNTEQEFARITGCSEDCARLLMPDHLFRSWHYQGDGNDFQFIGISRLRSQRAEKFSVIKINKLGVYLKNNLADRNDLAEAINANNVDELAVRYLPLEQRKTPEVAFEFIHTPAEKARMLGERILVKVLQFIDWVTGRP